jgi:hypothetical protein
VIPLVPVLYAKWITLKTTINNKMKKSILILLISLFTASLGAQTKVKLRITHEMNGQAFALNTATKNNLDNSLNFTRVQYYLSGIKLTDDTGKVHTLSDVYLLVDASKTEDFDLGTITFSKLKTIAFSTGVDKAKNHLNPANYSMGHPLAPKSPTMHWGWTSGYRFAALEGKTGTSFSKTWELHGLFDDAYQEVVMPITSTMENGDLIITMTADYAMALNYINVEGGLISHGLEEDDKQMLHNFKNHVFLNSDKATEVSDLTKGEIYAYPAPSYDGKIFLSKKAKQNIQNIVIYNVLGEEVLSMEINSNFTNLMIPIPGMYFISYVKDNKIVHHQKIIVTQ